MSDEWPSVLIVGGAGVIGQVVGAGWRGPYASFDLPDGDALNRDALTTAARGHDALVHLAWDIPAENYSTKGFAPDNLVMTVNAVEAALAAGVPRVVLASSVHADAFWPPPQDGLLDPARTPVPDSPYGSSKVFMEAFGRHAAAHRGLEVVAIRFGGVNPDDRQPDDPPPERAAWLPHAACVSLVHAAVTAPLPPSRFALVVGVGDHPYRVHAFGDDLGWSP